METHDVETELLQIQDELAGYAHALTHDSNNAADLVQDTSLRILCSIDMYEPGTNFGAWAHTVMRNTFLNSIRDKGRRVYIEEVFLVENSSYCAADNYSDTDCDIHDIYRAISKLPLAYREIVFFLTQGYSPCEIADITGLPDGTVRSRIHYARRILKKLLNDYLE